MGVATYPFAPHEWREFRTPGDNESAPIRQVRSRAPWLVQTET